MDIAASRSYPVWSGSSRLGLTVLDPSGTSYYCMPWLRIIIIQIDDGSQTTHNITP